MHGKYIYLTINVYMYISLESILNTFSFIKDESQVAQISLSPFL